MKNKFFCLICAAAFAPFLNAGAPTYQPPFSVENVKRVKPTLQVTGFPNCESVVLTAGDKRIGFLDLEERKRLDRNYIIGVYKGQTEQFRIVFWGTNKNGWGFPFKDIPGKPGTITYSKENGTITYSKPYLLADGKEAIVSYRLKALENGMVELTWSPGISEEQIKNGPAYTLEPWLQLIPTVYREQKISADRIVLEPAPLEKLKPTIGQEVKTWIGKASRITFNDTDPQKCFSVITEQPYSVQKRERYWNDSSIPATIMFNMPRTAPRRLLIDLGQAAVANKALPPPVGGIDFWRNDATLVTVRPTKNVMMNPSFNQGLRYYYWMSGGATYEPAENGIFHYAVDPVNGRNGGPCLVINPVQRRSASLRTALLPLVKGREYVFSCYARAEKDKCYVLFRPFGTKCNHSWKRKDMNHQVGKEWKRISFQYRYEGGSISAIINCWANGRIWIDDVQVEEADAPTEFAAPAMEGNLLTSDPDNLIDFGKPVNARFQTFGAAGTVELTLFDFYREKLWSAKYQVNGGDIIPLPFDERKPRLGNFVLEAKFTAANGQTYTDHYRFNVMRFLHNTHPTKDFYGTEARPIGRICRADAYARLMMISGMGSTGYGNLYLPLGVAEATMKKYRIHNMVYTMGGHDGFRTGNKENDEYLQKIVTKAEAITPEDEKRIEEITYNYVKNTPQADIWSFNHEEESRSPILRAQKFDEWAKVLAAFHRGVTRANPKAIVLPDGGTTNFHPGQKRSINEQYILSTAKRGIRWSGFATHPYGSLDGTAGGNMSDLDEVTSSFLAMLDKYGYKNEPLYYTEGFNIPSQYIPEWGSSWWNDGYIGGKPNYDFSLREFNHAGWIARSYLICLKYWPRLRRFDCWSSNLVFDYCMTPYGFMNAINTLGNLLEDPKYLADIRPAPNVRGYAYEDAKNGEIAAVWCISEKVENGVEKGPELSFEFDGDLSFYDVMGNKGTIRRKDGRITIPLTQVPIFLQANRKGILIPALQNAEVIGGESNLKIEFQPAPDGSVNAEITNITGRSQSGKLTVGKDEFRIAVAPNGKTEVRAAPSSGCETGKMYDFHKDYSIQLQKGNAVKSSWNMQFFYVPYAGTAPDWKKIPAMPVTNLFLRNNYKYDGPKDFSANYQLAWNEKALYLRVTVTDDHFIADPRRDMDNPFSRSRLYQQDGCLEVYFDCGANGRSSYVKNFDDDDYRYDFSFRDPSAKSAPGQVYRLVEVHSQLAGGVAMPDKKEAAANVKCQFTRTADGYTYDVVFPQRYIEPLALRKDFRAGFSLYLHDRDSLEEVTGHKGLNLSTEKGKHVDHAPHLWPVMILQK